MIGPHAEAQRREEEESGEGTSMSDRESVLDGKVHLEPEIIREIPEVPMLCDTTDSTKRKVDVGDGKVFCEEHGEGPAIVLLHGGPGGTHHYFHPYLSGAADFARVIYYDQLGCGQSDYLQGKEEYSVEQAADHLDALRKQLGLDKWFVLGHSYGGTLAQCYALAYPERLSGLVLVNSGIEGLGIPNKGPRRRNPFSEEEKKRIKAIHADKSLSLAQLVFNAHLNGDWKRQCFYRPTVERLAMMARYEWNHDDRLRSQICNSTNMLDLKGYFDRCPLPILIIDSNEDLTWSEGKAQKLHECFPGSRLVLFERSAHAPFEDETEKFVEVLGKFVRGAPAVSVDAVSLWKDETARLKAEKERQPAYLIQRVAGESDGYLKIAAAYTSEWLEQLEDPVHFLLTGLFLYDVKRYEEALAVFRQMATRSHDSRFYTAVALVWQGHMLDLLDRRVEAISVYDWAAEMDENHNIQHGQYGLYYRPSEYAEERKKTPFQRIERKS